MLNYLFQILPIILAIIAAISCSYRYSSDRRKTDRAAMILGVFSAVLLIIAQTSWWASYIIDHSLQGTVFANYVWTVFNSVTMLTLIVLSNPFRK